MMTYYNRNIIEILKTLKFNLGYFYSLVKYVPNDCHVFDIKKYDTNSIG